MSAQEQTRRRLRRVGCVTGGALAALADAGAETIDGCGLHVHVSRAGFAGVRHAYRWTKSIYRNQTWSPGWLFPAGQCSRTSWAWRTGRSPSSRQPPVARPV
jgi:hypothetical protein